jgi:hypothetical protein
MRFCTIFAKILQKLSRKYLFFPESFRENMCKTWEYARNSIKTSLFFKNMNYFPKAFAKTQRVLSLVIFERKRKCFSRKQFLQRFYKKHFRFNPMDCFLTVNRATHSHHCLLTYYVHSLRALGKTTWSDNGQTKGKVSLLNPQSKEVTRGPPELVSALSFIGGVHIGAVALRVLNC